MTEPNRSASHPATGAGRAADGGPEIVDLARTDDPRDAVHRAVACLAGGGVVALPAESCYALVGGALQVPAVERIHEAVSKHGGTPPALIVRGEHEVVDWVPRISRVGRRLVTRAWPGPVALRFVGQGIDQGLCNRLPEVIRSCVAPDGVLTLARPASELISEVARLSPGPLLLGIPHDEAGRPAGEAATLARLAAVDMCLDDGPVAAQMPTVVRVDDAGWQVESEDSVTGDAVARMAATMVIFVCTGNTCRSPMAEALFKHRLAKRLDLSPEELEEGGFVVRSAGLAATHGAQAAEEAVVAVARHGARLEGHASRPLTPELARQADWIVPMTFEHRNAILEFYPELSDRVRLLDPLGDDLDDPIGRGPEVYRRTAESIDRFVQALVDDLLRDRS